MRVLLSLSKAAIALCVKSGSMENMVPELDFATLSKHGIRRAPPIMSYIQSQPLRRLLNITVIFLLNFCRTRPDPRRIWQYWLLSSLWVVLEPQLLGLLHSRVFSLITTSCESMKSPYWYSSKQLLSPVTMAQVLPSPKTWLSLIRVVWNKLSWSSSHRLQVDWLRKTLSYAFSRYGVSLGQFLSESENKNSRSLEVHSDLSGVPLSCSFWEIFGQIIGWRTEPWRLARLVWEILDPPLKWFADTVRVKFTLN